MNVPAGIRTRVGSSGGSQDIHYPTETTAMPPPRTVKGRTRSCRENDIFHYTNATYPKKGFGRLVITCLY